LRVAAVLAAVQGLGLVCYAVLELLALTGGRVTMGLTTAAFFAAYGVMLLVSGRALLAGRAWGRGPVLFAQLVWLGVAWSFRGGDTTWVSATLAVVAVVTIAGLVLPASRAALEGEDR
jgi:hypothetical protein